VFQIKEYPWKDRRSTYIRQIEPSALEIAAEQMRIWPNYDSGTKTALKIVLFQNGQKNNLQLFGVKCY
jgi:Myotubularin protein